MNNTRGCSVLFFFPFYSTHSVKVPARIHLDLLHLWVKLVDWQLTWLWLILKQLLMKFSRVQSWCFIWKPTKKAIYCPDMHTLLHLINANKKHSSCFYFKISTVVTDLFSRRITRSFTLCLLLTYALFSKILISRQNIHKLAPSYLDSRTYCCVFALNRANHFWYLWLPKNIKISIGLI